MNRSFQAPLDAKSGEAGRSLSGHARVPAACASLPVSPLTGAGRERRLEVGGGTSLHCVQWGSGDTGDGAVPFLLVHGLASNCRTWERVAGLLAARGHPVAAVDQRGHGRSDAPDDGYEFATLCDDLVAALDALGYEQAVVAGQSTGGNIAVELARRSGDRLAGVAGVDGGAIELQDRWPRWDDCAAVLAPPRLAGTPVAAITAMLRRSHPDWDDWAIDATLANLEVVDGGSVRARHSFDHHMLILRALWEHRPSQVFPDLAVPVALILADSAEDGPSGSRASVDRAAGLLARGRIQWVPGADHDIHVQQPATVADFLVEAADDGFFDT